MDEKIAKLSQKVPEFDKSYVPYMLVPGAFMVVSIASLVDFFSGLSHGRFSGIANVAFYLILILSLASFLSFGYAHSQAKRAMLRRMLAGKK